MDACTIIAKNYLAHARTLAASYVEHHPDATFYVLIIDDVEGFIDPASEPFELVAPADLDIPSFERMAVIYDVMELSTAVKPWLLRWLLARSAEGALYLDPDMRLYLPLDNVFDAVREHKLVLSPHNIEPMPRDGKRPNEQDILIAGVYNLGFIGIGSGEFADMLLDWWGERLERDCINDPERGFFVDQRWIDLVPSLTDSFHLLRDAGFNVAYWNLATRPVSFREGQWWVKDDVPLRLFHFSGYDANRPASLSKHQNRIQLDELPELRTLCDGYGEELRANGVNEVAKLPYTYATTASGIQLNNAMRRIHRDLFTSDFEESVFEPEGERAFIAALNEPAEVGGNFGVTRYLSALYDRRPDLQNAYPNLGADASGFLDWVNLFGRREVPIPPALLPGDVFSREPGTPVTEFDPVGPLGVNVAGYLQSELGVGEVARQAIEALDIAGVPTLPVSIPAPLSRQGHHFNHIRPYAESYPVNLMCVNADMLPDFVGRAGSAFFHRRYSIGWWWWEVSKFPERWMDAFAHVDEVWAGSQFVADALAAVSPVPVVHVPTPVTKPVVGPVSRAELGLPEGFLFLFMYDFNSVFARKNPLGTLEAFLRAFPEDDAGPQLVLKSINAEHHPVDHERLKRAAAGHAHVHLVDRYVTPSEKNGFVAASDCYVSLHRSEGFGFGMAEAMLLGKPVIATGYSGNMDFMTGANSYPVDFAMAPIGPGADPYPAEAEWAEPDLEHAAQLMRDVVANREEAARRGAKAAEDVARTNSSAAAGAVMAQRVKAAHAGLKLPKSQPAGAAALERAGAAEALLRGGSRPAGNGRLGKVRQVPRKGVLRAMRPHTAHQRQLDDQLTTGLRNAADELVYLRGRHEELLQRHIESQAAVLLELRRVNDRLGRLEAARLDDRLVSTDARIDDLAQQVNALRAGATLSGDAGDPDTVASEATGPYPSAPQEPWSEPYNEAHAAFVARELEDADLAETLRSGGALPERFGRGFDERVVEFPWVGSQQLSGRVLDAGSALNHAHVLQRLRPRMDDLHVVTLEPEPESFPKLHISYLYADLRDLPMRDGSYDHAVSISTFEHIGLDNAYYGSDVAKASDPQAECVRALTEVRRVLTPGGSLYLTVPIGKGERFEWVRTLTPDELDELIAGFGSADATVRYFRHDGGWRTASREEVADARYRDHFSSGPPGPDRVVAAEAVACVHLLKRG
ncbi:glycosyltransferase involved in cell wall biosynthesis [Solirubrobacter pauli]|uniref:Glycosyltransferase involved in cell wall biosynthesis n=1 Tax=Solirubrobacter pauli TaxID=166793 RepID=A0A660LCW1_9ACTN|nr:methyltransferase domain-containing protein [Solirubrobacter pauli]RKQ92887.1 glycosyltransferase involved in cell wall biosynthesis [Solirubrobacter pauli]